MTVRRVFRTSNVSLRGGQIALLRSLRRPALLPLALAAAIAATSLPARGADDGATASDKTASLETITVTATKRAVDIDSVPVAVTAIEGEQLKNATIRDTQSLPMLSPSLQVTVSGNETSGSVIRIRGIGTGASNPGLEGAVGVFVDGVYRARAGLALNDLVDIDQIEVLRGPQSTLFGKSTSAGVISVSTNKPTISPEASVYASLGNYSGSILGLVLDGPAPVLDNTLALRFAAQYDKRDGYIDDPTRNDAYNDRDRWLGRGQALWKPNDDFSLRLIVDSSRKMEHCCAAPYSYYGQTSAAIASLGGTVYKPVAQYTSSFDYPLRAEGTDNGVSAQADWNLGWAKASAIVGYRDGRGSNIYDGDYNDLSIAYLPLDKSSTINKTAEFTLHGQTEWLDWMTGAYYEHDTLGFDGSTLFGPDAGPYLHALYGVPASVYAADTGQTLRQARQTGHNDSVYTHDIIHLGGGFDLTLGVRYLEENKSGWGYASSNATACHVASIPGALKLLCAVPYYQADYDDSRTVGTAGLSKYIGDLGTLYLTYSDGFKAGGINLDPSGAVGAPTFKPETVDSWEAGLKMPFLDDRLQTRTAVYYSDFKNVQLSAYNGVSYSITNAASVQAKGIEFEADWHLSDELTLRGGAAYNHALYGTGSAANLIGKQMTNAPRRTAVIALDYQRPVQFVGASTLYGNLSVHAQSEVNTGVDLDPKKAQGGYALLNSRLGLRFPGDWDVSLWSNNLTNRFYYTIIFNSVIQSGSYNGFVGLPRTYGIEVRKGF